MVTFTIFDLKPHTFFFFFALKSISQVLLQLFRALRSFCKATWPSMKEIVLYNLASSAKRAMRAWGEKQDGMPLVKITKSKGPRIESCGTLDVTGNKSECALIDDHSLQSALQITVEPGKEWATDTCIPELLNKLGMVNRVKCLWEVQVHQCHAPCHR